jgi:chromosome segregation ATPase
VGEIDREPALTAQPKEVSMRALGRTVAGSGLVSAVVALAIVGGAAVVAGQNRNEPADPGSLAALTAEVRELRLAVQQLSQTQSQTQALGVYLTVQQSRVLQVSSQVDAARKELDAAALRSNDVATKLADFEEELPRVSDPAKRADLQGASRAMKREHETATLQEQQARARELELSQSLQAEESRWSALIARLEALTQR